ncbi:MAG: glycosyltransferase [Pseudomonadota bacterium]
MDTPTLPFDDLKIIHATECLAAGTLTFLVQATRELADSGVRQSLVFARRPDTPAAVEALFDPRVELVEIAAPRGLHLGFLRNLRHALLQQMQDAGHAVVHLHSSKAGFLGRLALLGLRDRPASFYSPHGLSFLNRHQRLRSAVFRTLEWLAARIDTTLVGCSRSEAALLGRIGGRPARVLENAVDDSFFAVRRREDAPALVLSIGRVCFQKAPERFAALATRFLIAEMPARFVWVGAGDAEGEACLRAAGVEVTGWVGRDEVQRLLGMASVYVQTSRWEGMPLSVLQALAAGVPCVVNDAVGNRDAVRQGMTGFVTSSLDEMLMAVRRLLHDDTLRRRLSISARRDAVERFSSASFRTRLCRLYGLPLHGAQATLPVPDNLLRFPSAAAAATGSAVATPAPSGSAGGAG